MFCNLNFNLPKVNIFNWPEFIWQVWLVLSTAVLSLIDHAVLIAHQFYPIQSHTFHWMTEQTTDGRRSELILQKYHDVTNALRGAPNCSPDSLRGFTVLLSVSRTKKKQTNKKVNIIAWTIFFSQLTLLLNFEFI